MTSSPIFRWGVDVKKHRGIPPPVADTPIILVDATLVPAGYAHGNTR